MADITNGEYVTSLDFPPTAYASDDTLIQSVTNTSYEVGSPEVGTYFIAPTSGRVSVTVGGGLRDQDGVDRVALSPHITRGGPDGTVVLSASVTLGGIGSNPGVLEFMYTSRTSMVEGLTPGEVYYAQVRHVVFVTDALSPSNDVDIQGREIIVSPLP